MNFRTPFPWNPGEHISVMGQTGSGKSTLMGQVLTTRKFEVIFRTKPDDVKYDVDIRTKLASEMSRVTHNRILLVPDYRRQKQEISAAIEYVWKVGGFTVYVDELFYITERLKLEEPVERLLTQGRSKSISVVTGMQRPARISRFAISESTHVISFFLEGRDRKLIRDSASEDLAEAIYNLERFQFAWWHRPSRQIWVGRYQDLVTGEKVAV